MRLLSAALTNSKNQIDGGSPWTMLFELQHYQGTNTL